MKNRDDIYSITAGTFLMAVGVNSFFETHNLVIGGASGLAILISSALYRFFALNPSMWLLYLSINIPLFLAGFIVMGFKKLKKVFTPRLCFRLCSGSRLLYLPLIPT
ncbi:MAG: YitT family protein [Clostridiales bacterium]|nr:YitT family protein [Clostridiales bacterium]